jgi:hypothetical protein
MQEKLEQLNGCDTTLLDTANEHTTISDIERTNRDFVISPKSSIGL